MLGDLLGAESDQPLDFGVPVCDAGIQMDPVLAGTRFRHSLQPEPGGALARRRQEQEVAVVLGDLNPERFRPEAGEPPGIDAVDGAMPSSRVTRAH